MATARPMPNEAPVLRLSRRLKAPRERVFRALTEPAQLAKWWGPRGFTLPELTMDVRVGGAWRTVMRSPEGNDHIVAGVYREIAPPERLVFTWAWETDGRSGHETVVTIELSDAGGETDVDLTQRVFESDHSRDMHRQGWTSTFDCLAELLASDAIDRSGADAQ